MTNITLLMVVFIAAGEITVTVESLTGHGQLSEPLLLSDILVFFTGADRIPPGVFSAKPPMIQSWNFFMMMSHWLLQAPVILYSAFQSSTTMTLKILKKWWFLVSRDIKGSEDSRFRNWNWTEQNTLVLVCPLQLNFLDPYLVLVFQTSLIHTIPCGGWVAWCLRGCVYVSGIYVVHGRSISL